MSSRTVARNSLMVVRRQIVGGRGEMVYSASLLGVAMDEAFRFREGSIDVILRTEGSVRTRAFSRGLLDDCGVSEGGLKACCWVERERIGVEEMALVVALSFEGAIAVPGSKVWVRNVREVSTSDKRIRMVVQISSTISSSFKKFTSRFVGWTFTSTRAGSISSDR